MKKLLIAHCAAFLLLGVLGLGLAFGLDDRLKTQPYYPALNGVVAYAYAPGSGMRAEDLPESFRSVKAEHYTGFCSGEGSLWNEQNFSTARLCYVDSRYFTVFPHTFYSGGAFLANAVEGGANQLILSEKLAIAFFGTWNAVGLSLMVNGETYTVAGVYAKGDQVMDTFFNDGTETVFLPITTLPVERRTADVLVVLPFVSAKSGDGAGKGTGSQSQDVSGRIVQIEQTLSENLRNQGYSYQVTAHIGEDETLRQSTQALVFALGAWTCFVLAGWLLWLCGRWLCHWQRGKQRAYFWGVWKKEWQGLALYGVLALAAVFCIVLVIANIRFPLRIPSEFLPESNVFDLTFYADLMRKMVNHYDWNQAMLWDVFAVNLRGFTLAKNTLLVFGFVLLAASRGFAQMWWAEAMPWRPKCLWAAGVTLAALLCAGWVGYGLSGGLYTQWFGMLCALLFVWLPGGGVRRRLFPAPAKNVPEEDE